LRPLEQFAVYAPEHARLAELPLKNGDAVAADSPLLRMDSPTLDARNQQNQARREGLSWQSAAAGFDPETRRDWQLLDQQLTSAQAEAGTINADAGRYAPHAPYAGRLVDLDPDLRVGDWLGNRELLGRLIRDGGQQVVSYVDDEDIQRLNIGDRALFVGDGSDAPIVRLHVIGLDRDASRILNEPELASVFGGHVQVREKNGALYPERAAYRVLLAAEPNDDSAQHTWRGNVTIAGQWEAPGLRYLRSALRVIWRETGF
jgi:putative peptide zinc metalloprotease protein